jgi:hypothetical protein
VATSTQLLLFSFKEINRYLCIRAKVRLCLKQKDITISWYRLDFMSGRLLVWFLIREIHGEWVVFKTGANCSEGKGYIKI